jgi:hypothetical protein
VIFYRAVRKSSKTGICSKPGKQENSVNDKLEKQTDAISKIVNFVFMSNKEQILQMIK